MNERRWRVAVTLCLLLAVPACGGGSAAKDAAPRDAAADGVAPGADAGADAAPDGGEIAACVQATPITCGTTLSATTVGLTGSITSYPGCIAGGAWLGPELVYSFQTDTDPLVTVVVYPTGSQSFDLFELEAECDPAKCVRADMRGGAISPAGLGFAATPGQSYFLVVDSLGLVGGLFDLEVVCEGREYCDNGVDDNDDGLVDCCDPQCAGETRCAESYACGDGVDNNCNGVVDCHDDACFGQMGVCEESCTNGLDDNDDGLADCRDPRCATDGACAESCANGLDDNDDGLTDCADPRCYADNACAEDCTNGLDDNHDGQTDCADPHCATDAACAEDCGNGLDDNHDGLTDCADPRCHGDPACAEICDNGRDDDLNGLVDCADLAACAQAANCVESACADSADNDGDGLTDCADDDCAGTAACTGGSGAPGAPCATHADCASGACLTELGWGWPGGSCAGGWPTSETCDGVTCDHGSVCVELYGFPRALCLEECDAGGGCPRPGYSCVTYGGTAYCSPDCSDASQCGATHFCSDVPTAAGFLCRPPLEVCTGGVDEDGDGRTDCADPDCVSDPACGPVPWASGGDICAYATPLTMPANDRGLIAVAGLVGPANTDAHTPACSRFGGPGMDVVYAFTLTRATRVSAGLWVPAWSPLFPPLLSLTRGCGGPDLQCAEAESVTFDLWAVRLGATLEPGTYHLWVDCDQVGYGWYTLGVDFADP
jgi:hypothetical protein